MIRKSFNIRALFFTISIALMSGHVSSVWSMGPPSDNSHHRDTDVQGTSAYVRGVALLDLTARNRETSNSTFGLRQSLDAMGIPYVITESVDEAVKHAIVCTSSYLESYTLKRSEKDELVAYVSGGGVLVSTNVDDNYLNSLFGIAGASKTNTRRLMSWQVQTHDPALKYFDDPKEITISLGESSAPSVINTRGYVLSGATPLGNFDDGSAAVTKNHFGAGSAYVLGMSYTDMVVRNQLNLDFNAQRTYSNGFEPTSDTIMLFLRSIYESSIPHAVWKHTAPAAAKAALIITHDVDSQSSMDLMGRFADLEARNRIKATYNITTHYIDDDLAGDYYTPNMQKMLYLKSRGQAIASHSVGHFPDWHHESAFPQGLPGNTAATYTPYNNGTSTTGGTVYGELEVSKKLLEADLNVTVTTFRSGYLLWNNKQINALEALGYRYDSSMSANDVLTNFPYLMKRDGKLSGGVSSIYEIPMTISDRGITAANYTGYVANWLDVMIKNAANAAPTVLLIHPNRDFKVTAEDMLLKRTPRDIAILDMDAFGNYWSDRARLTFNSVTLNNILYITISDSTSFPMNPGVSLQISQARGLRGIRVMRESGAPVWFASSRVGQDMIIHSFRTR